jgi:thiol-disulfide isomerase/thioredoxin
MGVSPASLSLPSFDGNTGWLNSPPLSASDLRGKVVLVDFWEYTCINCLRTLPYLRAWNARYRDDGLVIVGVHTNEFGFSGQSANVAAAAKHLEVTWPIALDDKNAIWNRFKNDGWPHEYLFDQSGKLVDSVSGEGQYPETEAKIQALLKAANPQLTLPPVMALLPQDSYTRPGAMCYIHTPELLVGQQHIADAGSNVASRDSTYVDRDPDHKDGALYLQGVWRLTSEAAISNGVPGYVALKYHAIETVAVLTPGPDGKSLRVDVTQDGAPIPKSDAGSDVQYDAGGSYLTVDQARAYEITMNATFGQHELRLSPAAPGMGLYSFAFEACEAPAKSS